MTSILDRSCFMDIYVSGLSCHNPFISLQHGTDDHRVGLGASNQKINLPLRAAAGFPNLFLGSVTIGVRPISRQLLHIGFCQMLQNFRMSPFPIVILKKKHFIPSLSPYEFKFADFIILENHRYFNRLNIRKWELLVVGSAYLEYGPRQRYW